LKLRSLWVAAWALSAFSAQAAPMATQPHVTVELISQTSTLQPGQPVTLGFHFKIDHGWHLYWSNPGDSGLAPEFIWTLPDGFSAQPVLWPTPQRLAAPSLMDYGYKNDVLLMVPVQVPADAHPGQIVTFPVLARWLVCNDICIPGRVKLQIKMVVKPKKPGPSKRASLFNTALKSLPPPWPAQWKAQGILDAKTFHLAFSTREKPSDAWFFPLNPNQIDNVAAQNFHFTASTVHLTLKRSDQLTADVKTLDGLIVLKTKSGTKGYSVSIPLSVESVAGD
jgi:DsbC/DsbD-like thiol-disulfide interchange protein